MSEPEMPASLEPHEPDFKPDAWKQWSPLELGMAVAFFTKRAGHRSNPQKRAKDLRDAQNYLNMLQSHVDASKA